MSADRHTENSRTLASILGVPEDAASERLRASIQVTWDDRDQIGMQVGEFVVALLERTFESVGATSVPISDSSIEVLINNATPQLPGLERRLYCNADSNHFYCGQDSRDIPVGSGNLPPVLCLMVACFVAAQAAHHSLRLPAGRCLDSGVEFSFTQWPGVPLSTWMKETHLGRLQIAGAGAVGNAFLYALQYLPVTANGHIVDPKKVTGGILNRCLLFKESDVGQPKASVLAKQIKETQPGLKLEGLEMTIQEARAVVGEFDCIVSGVDSRRARRSLQLEAPREVFDASTTGIEEIVFHHNLFHLAGACMGCIYSETSAERTFAQHVAEVLNVSEDEVAEGFINQVTAEKICRKYQDISPATIIGTAYDSLFRNLCAAGNLVTPEQKQVLAPFAFISQLAGTVLAIEFFLRRQSPDRAESFNYWRIDPWRGLVPELQQNRGQTASCAICRQSNYQRLLQKLWGN